MAKSTEIVFKVSTIQNLVKSQMIDFDGRIDGMRS